jgi:orotate phosphoribosyltransferase
MAVDTELVRLAQDMSAQCRLTGQFRLRSGQVADEYFDKYLFEADPVLLGRVVSRMVDLLPADTDMLGGLELGGVPLAVLLNQKTGTPVLCVRKEAKTHCHRCRG